MCAAGLGELRVKEGAEDVDVRNWGAGVCRRRIRVPTWPESTGHWDK